MNNNLKLRIAKLIAVIVIAGVGCYMIDDGKIVVGVFLLMWSNNIGQSKEEG